MLSVAKASGSVVRCREACVTDGPLLATGPGQPKSFLSTPEERAWVVAGLLLDLHSAVSAIVPHPLCSASVGPRLEPCLCLLLYPLSTSLLNLLLAALLSLTHEEPVKLVQPAALSSGTKCTRAIGPPPALRTRQWAPVTWHSLCSPAGRVARSFAD